jgi:4-amino-4-deoxy-L-arabinose transferase-like glycosyltransferase
MTGKSPTASRKNLIWIILLGIVIACGIALRFLDLDADPPLYFDGYGKSLSTDPHQYTFHARNKILFGESDPLGDDKWRVFEFTLVSGVSYLIFALFGVSRYHANLSGLLLSLFAIILFLIAIKKIAGVKGALIAALFLLFNKVLFVYGRLPYLENGLLVWAAMLFFIIVYFRQNLWWKIAMGAILALATFAGKIFGVILVVPVLATLWLENKKDFPKNLIIIVASLLTSSLLWILIAYGGRIGLLTQYLFQQTIGLYGFPDALKSPLAFFEKLISFGNESLFYSLAPALGVAGFVALVIIIFAADKKRLQDYIPALFLIFWCIASQLFLMAANYRPLRYMYMLYFPLAGLAAFAFSRNHEFRQTDGRKSKLIIHLFLFFIIWLLLENIAYGLNRMLDIGGTYEEISARVVWLALAPALVLTFLIYRFPKLKNILAKPLIRNSIVVILIVATLVEFELDFNRWRIQKSYNIKEAGQDLGEILNRDAIIVGPMAPTLLLENNLKGMFYAVGISKNDSLLFEKYPATHFAIDLSASSIIGEEFPRLKEAKLIADYWIRDSNVGIYRIDRLTGNVVAQNYIPTDYEKACQFLESDQRDSAQFYAGIFFDKNQRNKSVLKLLSDLYAFDGEIIASVGAIKTAAAIYPDDFSLTLALAAACQKAFIATGDKSYQSMAYDNYSKVLIKNPFQSDEIENITRQIAALKPNTR